MTITRRNLVAGLAAAGALSGAVAPTLGRTASRSRFRAVVFDGFPIIDPRPVAALAEQLFPGNGAELSNSWRTRQFEYCWLRTLSDRYADFRQVTQEALVFAAKSLRLDLSASTRDRLVQSYFTLSAWPDVLPALRSLKAAGIRMAFLSNLTAEMLDAAVRNSALNDFFEAPLTTDRVRAFKPDPRAYQMAMTAFDCAREEIAFVASAGWDVAGAKWFGYPTFWVNRMELPAEELGAVADAQGRNMADLVPFVLGSAPQL
jgi:2-haloacid dehalogenase